MLTADDAIENNEGLARIFLYGEEKTKKTWWACAAAEAGYNIILLDGDKGYEITKNLSKEARQRIRLIRCNDTLDRPQFVQVLVRLLRGGEVIWDGTDQRLSNKITAGHAHYRIDLSRLTANDILIVDSWTAVAKSIIHDVSIEKEIDLTDIKTAEKWQFFGYTTGVSAWAVEKLKNIKGNTIVIGHAEIYDKIKKGTEASKNPVIEFSRMQAASVTKNDAMKLGKEFTDILYFTMQGSNYFIDTRKIEGRMGGSRVLAPNLYAWDKLQFRDYAVLANMQPGNPELPCLACQLVIGDEENKTEAPKNVILESKNTLPAANILLVDKAKPTGISAMLAARKASMQGG